MARKLVDQGRKLRSVESSVSVLKTHISELEPERDTWQNKCQDLQQSNLDLYQEVRITRRRLQRAKQAARNVQLRLDDISETDLAFQSQIPIWKRV